MRRFEMIRIYNGRDHFFQWDANQKVIINEPTATEAHFCNRTDDCSLVCEIYEEDGLRVANVPNILLQNDWDIRVYIYCSDYTKIEKRFSVVRRSKPADYVYTETELKNYGTLENRIYALEDEDIKLNRRIDEAEALALGASSSKVYNSYSEMVEALNVMPAGELKVSQHILIRQVNVPDLWVSQEFPFYDAWEYTNDQAIIDELKIVSGFQVGYYLLSPLETQKVDLSDYAKKEDIPVIEYQLKENGAYTLVITEGVE